MNHGHITQFDFIDRYLMGKLADEESRDFEAHFIDCPQCITQLQMTNRFRQGLLQVVAEPSVQVTTRTPERAFRHLPQIVLRKPLVWAGVSLLLVLMAAVVFLGIYTRRLQSEVRQAERLAEQWQRRYDDERQAALAATARQQETASQRDEQLQQLEARLKDEQARREKAAASRNRQVSVGERVTLGSLIAVRGSEPGASTAANSFAISPSSDWFLLSVSLEGESQFETYRLTIFNEQGRRIGKRRFLTPDRNGLLVLPLPTSRFRPGYFSLNIEGVNPDGSQEPFGNYPFHIRKSH